MIYLLPKEVTREDFLSALVAKYIHERERVLPLKDYPTEIVAGIASKMPSASEDPARAAEQALELLHACEMASARKSAEDKFGEEYINAINDGELQWVRRQVTFSSGVKYITGEERADRARTSFSAFIVRIVQGDQDLSMNFFLTQLASEIRHNKTQLSPNTKAAFADVLLGDESGLALAAVFSEHFEQAGFKGREVFEFRRVFEAVRTSTAFLRLRASQTGTKKSQKKSLPASARKPGDKLDILGDTQAKKADSKSRKSAKD